MKQPLFIDCVQGPFRVALLDTPITDSPIESHSIRSAIQMLVSNKEINGKDFKGGTIHATFTHEGQEFFIKVFSLPANK